MRTGVNPGRDGQMSAGVRGPAAAGGSRLTSYSLGVLASH